MRDRWITEVFQADYIGDACRVLLLLLGQRMTDAGRVSVPRSELARALGRHEQRIAERIKEAREAGLLDQVGGGYRGVTAIYEALLPGAKGTGQRYPIRRKGTGLRYASSGTHSEPDSDLMRTGGAVRQRARDLGKSAATTTNAATVRALDVALSTGCYQCQLLSYRDERSTPCEQHRETA